jgi:hypothetical protein
MLSPIKVRCDASTDLLVEPYSFIFAYVDPDIAGKRAGEINTQQFTWHGAGDNESIVPIVRGIVDTTILLIVNAACVDLPDQSCIVGEHCGS